MAADATLRSSLRRVPGARAAVRAVHSTWQRVQPFPLPHYVASTPKIGGENPWNPFLPPTAGTLGAAATSEEAATFVMGLLAKLTPSDDYAMEAFHYRWSLAKFGHYWRYADLSTALWAAASLVPPTNYLEIGVNRGRGAAIVGAVCPAVSIYGFDLWVPHYQGQPNPGPDFVRAELKAVGHEGEAVLVSGESQRTLPAFLREQPALFFDLVTVDGDKSIAGFARDMAGALPRLKLGGVLVVDDLAAVPALRRVWRRVIERDARFTSWEFADAGYGVAIAIRVA